MRMTLFCLFAFVGLCQLVRADAPPESAEFFEEQIRPLLVERCYECHGGGTTKGNLSLESIEAARTGGDNGPAVMPGKPDESLLVEAIGYTGDIKMPPKQRLSEREIADLTAWIKAGAVWPATASTKPAGEEARPFVITDEHRRFWSFQPIRDVPVPAVKNPGWIVRPLDAFVLAELERRGLSPVASADRRTFIRRVTFDLTGLPPTPAEIDAYLADESTDAEAKVVDRLLNSPHYGERWARLWLDVARYGEDQAHTFEARMYSQGYRYRDWVVNAFNRDLPFDRFVLEQIAGDALDPLPGDGPYDRYVAMGYFALGPVYYADAGCAAKAALDELDDRIDTLARGFLGLTVSCARCHDHKFDPIPQTDYYALAGVFRSTNYREAPLVPKEVVETYEKGQAEVKRKEQAAASFLEGYGRKLAEKDASRLADYLAAVWKLRHPPEGQSAPSFGDVAKAAGLNEVRLQKFDRFLGRKSSAQIKEFDAVRTALMASAAGEPSPEFTQAAQDVGKLVVDSLAERDRIDREHAENLAAAPENEREKITKETLAKEKADLLAALFQNKGPFAVPGDEIEKSLDDAGKQSLAALRSEIEAAKKAAPPMYAFAHSLHDGEVRNMPLHVRGNPTKTAGEVPRRFLSILSGESPATFSRGSGRLELAQAIASPDNPLTARVIVNRIWQQHFGRGIVATPSNFGQLGERPTHPDLLDHLARQFIAHGWSLKWLHREIVLSATYRLGSAGDPNNAASDPDNVWLWRQNRRRLDVEAWRDAMLAASGSLDLRLAGPSVELTAADNRRRTLYCQISRHNLDGLLRLFDFPDPNITSDRRTVTTVPLQQLFVLNSDFMVQQAKSLAARMQSFGADDSSRIRRAFEELYARPASDAEVQLGLEFLAAAPAEGSRLSPWEQYAQILLGANEFAFVD